MDKSLLIENNVNMLQKFIKYLADIIPDGKRLLFGGLTSVLGYFGPIKDMVNFMVALFIIDVVIGYITAKKLRKERFQVKIIWEHTMPRLALSLVLTICTYVWDTVYKVEVVSTYAIISWFISGLLIVSIAHNSYKLTKWDAFKTLGTMFERKTKNKIKQNEDTETAN